MSEDWERLERRWDRKVFVCYKSLFGYNDSVPFPHTNGTFPSVSKEKRTLFSQEKRSPNGTVLFLPNRL